MFFGKKEKLNGHEEKSNENESEKQKFQKVPNSKID